jgi:hypothetical protein
MRLIYFFCGSHHEYKNIKGKTNELIGIEK